MLEGTPPQATVGVEAVTARLRLHLHHDPPNVTFDENCERWLDHFIAAAKQETLLLPRRMQRALERMAEMTRTWGDLALSRGDRGADERW